MQIPNTGLHCLLRNSIDHDLRQYDITFWCHKKANQAHSLMFFSMGGPGVFKSSSKIFIHLFICIDRTLLYFVTDGISQTYARSRTYISYIYAIEILAKVKLLVNRDCCAWVLSNG